ENGEHGVFSESELCEMGASLGADVPFCIVGGRARCRGIGDEIEILSDLERQFYVIVQSDFLCDTKKAYSLYSPNVNRTKSNVFMDLYDDERIERVCDDLMNAGAKSACMTGSGSAVFGVFFDSNSAKSVYNKINYPFKTIACNVRRQS
ncbi:MAG: hypothetical protein FWF82_07105, partial [Oscillospiraceae bacterium]|nr:hypothetical protein [Oscillospiraceae bacterium]